MQVINWAQQFSILSRSWYKRPGEKYIIRAVWDEKIPFFMKCTKQHISKAKL